MNQHTKTLLMLAVVLVLAGIAGFYAYYGVYEKDAAQAKAEDDATRLFILPHDATKAPAEFVKLLVTFRGKTTTLVREPPEAWRIESPVKAKADALVLDALLTEIQTAKFQATLETNPDAQTLQQYGLQQPVFTVEAFARTADGMKSYTVRFEGGIENTFDGSTFMRKNGASTVHTVASDVRNALAKTTYDLRDKQPFSVDLSTLQKLTFKAKINSYALERDAEGQWTVTTPFTDFADKNQVTGMLGTLGNQKAKKFLEDTTANRQAFGLQTPQVDANFVMKGGQAIRFRFVKVTTPTPPVVYGLREDEAGTVLAMLPVEAMDALNRNAMDLRDKSLVRCEWEAVTQIVFHNADGTEVQVGRDAKVGSWWVQGPQTGKAKGFQVDNILRVLARSKISAAVEEAPQDWGKYGIESQSRYVSLVGAFGELARLTFGKAVPMQPGYFYARGTRNRAVTISNANFQDFPVHADDILEIPLGADAGVSDSTP